MTKLEELGHELNNIIVMNNVPLAQLPSRIGNLNMAIQKIAMKEAGVTASDLADENQESTPRIQYYWTLVSHVTIKVYLSAANQLSTYEGLDR